MYLKQNLNRSLINLNCQERAKTGFKCSNDHVEGSYQLHVVLPGRGRVGFQACEGVFWFYLSLTPFVCLSICRSLHLSISPFVDLSICLSLHLSISPFVYLSICLSLHLTISPFVYLSICLSPHLSISPFVYLSFCLPLHVYLYFFYLLVSL